MRRKNRRSWNLCERYEAGEPETLKFSDILKEFKEN